MSYEQLGPDGRPQSSLPWQERQRHTSSMAALLKTIRKVLLEPSEAFAQIQMDGSLGSSMVYVVLLGTVGGVAAILWQTVMHAGMAVGLAEQQPELLAAQAGGMAVFLVLWAVLTPLITLIGSLMGGLILHFCLWLVGGVKQPFEATYAVLAYASGSTALLNLVPFCGGMVAGIWALVIEVIGLTRVHECGTGRALLAVFLPMICCCVVGVVLVAVMLGVAAAGAA